MRKNFYSLLFSFAIVLFLYGTGYAQKEYQLPMPEEMSSLRGGLSGGAGDVGAIYYGATPANSGTRPVLVFIHGYTSSAKTWWENNDMYTRAFNDGYRTAFVSVHPDRNMWTNGQMFAGMLNTIANRYGVSRVVVVAHSKGGVDADAALVHYNAWNRVERTITLGSPHFGTQLANIAQSGWVSWLSAVFGQYNEATASLQTGYMDYFRSVTASNANNSRVNFRTFGAWNFDGVLYVSGALLNANPSVFFSGGNDGVVPYSSSRRPNSAVIFGQRDSRAKINHFEIAEGRFMWQYVRAQLPSALAREAGDDTEIAPAQINPNKRVSSRSQIISADRGQNSFIIEKGASKATVELYQAQEDGSIKLLDVQQQSISLGLVQKPKEAVLGESVRTVVLEQPQAGTYYIDAQSPYVAIITTENGIEMSFDNGLSDQKLVYQSGETMRFTSTLEGVAQPAEITGTLVRSMNLEGEMLSGSSAVAFRFQANAQGTYEAILNERLSPGIYSVSISARGNDFNKNLVTSIAVTEAPAQGLNELLLEESFLAYPNPSKGSTTFSFELPEKGQNALLIYDITGRLVQSFDLSDREAGKQQLRWEADQSLKNGVYLYELNSNGKRVTKKMILTR
jgi:pimeloyl-ACP methyl ester carboxylesterase